MTKRKPNVPDTAGEVHLFTPNASRFTALELEELALELELAGYNELAGRFRSAVQQMAERVAAELELEKKTP